jgi:hypothetical protein
MPTEAMACSEPSIRRTPAIVTGLVFGICLCVLLEDNVSTAITRHQDELPLKNTHRPAA